MSATIVRRANEPSITARLRSVSPIFDHAVLCCEAADEIERLREHLRCIVAAEKPAAGWSAFVAQMKEIARSALT